MEQRIGIERMEEAVNLFGSFDENIRLLEAEFQVQAVNRGGEIVVSGEPENVMLAVKAVQALLTLSGKGETITDQHVRYVIGLVRSGQSERISELTQDVICITSKGRPVKPKTIGQKEYVNAILKQTVTIGVGPAGTGKTYLAVAAAVAAFRDKQVNRIILTRPAVEAGERLGFLPGDLQSKVDPYLRPLYDALFDMLGAETYQKYLERGNIEVAPLAYMRGRTLDDSFIILDEAQNTSREQMKMFLTRMGFGSKVVITGDVTQIDLPSDKVSGLKEAMKVLRDVEGVAICKLTKEDVGFCLGETPCVNYAVFVFELLRFRARVRFENVVHSIGDDVAVGAASHSGFKLVLHEFGRIVDCVGPAEEIVVVPFVGEGVGPVAAHQEDVAGEVLRLRVAARGERKAEAFDVLGSGPGKEEGNHDVDYVHSVNCLTDNTFVKF